MKDTVYVIRRESFANRCKHFDGINFTEPEKKCKAGVRIMDVVVDQSYRYRDERSPTIYSSKYSLPCFTHDDPMGVCKCNKRELPTPEEVELWKAEASDGIARVMTARAAIVKAAGGKKPSRGMIDCPICDGAELRYSIASNGHIHGRCSTPRCVNWME